MTQGTLTDTALARVTRALLEDVVERVACRPDLWEPLVAQDPTGVHWERVAVPEDVEVFVVTWPTFTDTRLHSHDGAASAFVPVRGVVTEVRPDERLRLVPRKFVPGVTGVLDGYDVHELQNEHVEVAVSIHAFSPRLRSVTWWERQGDAFVPSASVPVDR
jgi:hypothetical protein